MIRTNRPPRLMMLLALSMLGSALLPAPAAADTRTVDCGAGRRIGPALRLPAGRQLLILVRGACNENVTIGRDDVTLRAGAPGATVNGTDPDRQTILIDGARRVVIDGLIVSGARNGIVGANGAVFTVQNATAQNNAQSGVVAIFGSIVTVASSRLVNNGGSGDPVLGRNGLAITDNSTGTIIGSTVSGNASSGIFVGRSSNARVGLTSRNEAGPNTIENNGGTGVQVAHGAQALIHGNTIQMNGGSGVSVDAAAATITANLLHQNDNRGVTVTNSGGARIGLTDRDTAAGNEIHHNGDDGIGIFNGANANFHGNLIELNGGDGVSIGRATGRSIGNNTIRSNAGHGISVNEGQLFQGKGDFGATPNRDVITLNGTGGVSGVGLGVSIFGAATADLRDVEITSNQQDGIGVFHGATLTIRSDGTTRSVLSGNGTRQGSSGSGINAFNGATVDVRDTDISGSTAHGISLSTRSSLALRGSTVSGNRRHGISAFNGSVVNVFRGSTISGNGTVTAHSGIQAFLGVSVSVEDSTVSGNSLHGVNAEANSSVSIGTSTSTAAASITGNTQVGLRVRLNSFGRFFGPVAVSIANNGSFGILCSESLLDLTSIPSSVSGNNAGGSQVFPDPFQRSCPSDLPPPL